MFTLSHLPLSFSLRCARGIARNTFILHVHHEWLHKMDRNSPWSATRWNTLHGWSGNSLTGPHRVGHTARGTRHRRDFHAVFAAGSIHAHRRCLNAAVRRAHGAAPLVGVRHIRRCQAIGNAPRPRHLAVGILSCERGDLRGCCSEGVLRVRRRARRLLSRGDACEGSFAPQNTNHQTRANHRGQQSQSHRGDGIQAPLGNVRIVDRTTGRDLGLLRRAIGFPRISHGLDAAGTRPTLEGIIG